MTLPTVAHDTFVIERIYPVPVTRVFGAWADPMLKARWFAGSAEALGAGYDLDDLVFLRQIKTALQPAGELGGIDPRTREGGRDHVTH